MGLLTSNEQGRSFLLNHSIYSKHRHPPLLSRSQETLEVCLSQGSSYESHTGGLDSRRLCGPQRRYTSAPISCTIYALCLSLLTDLCL